MRLNPLTSRPAPTVTPSVSYEAPSPCCGATVTWTATPVAGADTFASATRVEVGTCGCRQRMHAETDRIARTETEKPRRVGDSLAGEPATGSPPPVTAKPNRRT